MTALNYNITILSRILTLPRFPWGNYSYPESLELVHGLIPPMYLSTTARVNRFKPWIKTVCTGCGEVNNEVDINIFGGLIATCSFCHGYHQANNYLYSAGTVVNIIHTKVPQEIIMEIQDELISTMNTVANNLPP
jgi:molybdopterin-binding protein